MRLIKQIWFTKFLSSHSFFFSFFPMKQRLSALLQKQDEEKIEELANLLELFEEGASDQHLPESLILIPLNRERKTDAT